MYIISPLYDGHTYENDQQQYGMHILQSSKPSRLMQVTRIENIMGCKCGKNKTITACTNVKN